MMPLNLATQELRLAVDRAHSRGTALLLVAAENGQRQPHLALEDHRTQVVGDLCETLDLIDPGLGKKLLHALYPFTAEEGAQPPGQPLGHYFYARRAS